GQTSGNTISLAGQGAFQLNTMTIQAAALTVSLSAQPSAQNIVAGGTGIVLAKAILEGMVQRSLQRKTVLYWGVSKATDFYLNDFFNTFATQHEWFTYIPVLSGTDANWQGRTGLVHEAVLADHPDLSQKQIYASGPNDMVFAASAAFQTHGLKPHWFYSDTLERIGN
ncbi:MAG: hypothetical protein K5Q00_02960, partial [Gammaproteobacteria bacterium]|nr:hypothetical protein [Gammaproteobacteria bacterium]